MKNWNNVSTLELGHTGYLVANRMKVLVYKKWMKVRLYEMEQLSYLFKLAHRTANNVSCPAFDPIYRQN